MGTTYLIAVFTTESIDEALFSILCRMGYPNVILSGNGSQFVCRSMRNFPDMRSIAHKFSSIYHAQSNRIIERYQRCLKQMLSNVTAAFPSDSDKIVPIVVFAYTETPHRLTGYSSHELIFGTPMRDPLSRLRDMFIRPDVPQYQTYNSYLSDLRGRTIKGCQKAKERLAKIKENSVTDVGNCQY